LQKLSTFRGKKSDGILKTMRLAVRLSNIKNNLDFIRITLDELNKKEGFLIKA